MSRHARRSAQLVLLLVVVGQTVAAQDQAVPNTPQSEVSEQIEAAQQLIADERSREGIAALQAVCGQFPSVAPAWDALASAQEQAGDLTNAQAAYMRALALGAESHERCQSAFAFFVRNERFSAGAAAFRLLCGPHPDWIVQRTMYANLLRASGQEQQASAEFREIASFASGDFAQRSAPDLLHIGAACVETGRADDGVKVMRAAASSAPDSSSVWFWLGRAEAESGQVEQAIAHVRKAIDLAPEDASVALWFAEFSLEHSDETAVEAVDHLLQLRPDMVAQRVSLIKHLQGQGEVDELRRQQQMLAAWGSGNGWRALSTEEKLFLGAACIDTGRPDEALPVLEDVVQEAPKLAHHRLWLARAHEATGNAGSARREYEAAGALAPHDENVVSALVDARSAQGQTDGAILAIEELLTGDPGNLRMRTRLYHLLVQQGRTAELRTHQELLAKYAEGNDWKALQPGELLFVGAACIEIGRGEQAIPILEFLVEISGDVPAHHLWLAKARLGSGDEAAALRALYEALRRWPDEPDTMRECVDLYRYTRSRVVSQRLAEASGMGGIDAQKASGSAAGELVWLAHSDGQSPYRRELLVYAADLMRLSGEPWLARELYVEALETGADRCFSNRAQLVRNQECLDEVAGAPPLDLIEQCIDGLDECQKLLDPGFRLGREPAAAFARRWHAALSATFGLSLDASCEQWQGCLSQAPQGLYADLCRLALGEEQRRKGAPGAALATLEGVTCTLPSITGRCVGLRARAHMDLGDMSSAEAELTEALSALSRADSASAIAADLAERLAECAELCGRFPVARERYQSVLGRTPDVWQWCRARYALERIEVIAGAPCALGERVVALSDDRTTRGDWAMGYGGRHYTLCAQNYVLDRESGVGDGFRCSFATTDPDEPGRLWVSSATSNDPAALWDPVRRARVPANRDDFGEQRALGAGPDLLLSVDIPRGTSVLSLYFVNDSNYYEPNRRYTIALNDGRGSLVAISDVADFGGGVYKRFAVSGPLELNVRIWRNLSENTILAGVFLDELTPLRPGPCPMLAGESGPTRQLAEAYNAMSREMEGNASGVLRDRIAVTALVRDLEGARGDLTPRGADPATTRDSALVAWMLSECYRLVGDHRGSAGAFDDYLALLGQAYPDRKIEVYGSVAQALSGNEVTRRSTSARSHRAHCPPGQDRLSRIWDARLIAIESEPVQERAIGQLREVVLSDAAHISSYAKVRAFSLLEGRSAAATEEAHVLMAAAGAVGRLGDAAAGRELLDRAMRLSPSDEVLPLLQWRLLRAQLETAAPMDDAVRTFEGLSRHGGERKYASIVRSGLLDLAGALLAHGSRGQANELLTKYQEEHGENQLVARMIEECRGKQ